MRKRLWQAGLALALFVATLTAGNFFVTPDKAVSRRSAGHDFLAFYTAGTFVRTGHVDELYDLSAVKAFQQEIARAEGLEISGETFGPYWNPPFFAWVFAPLSLLSYSSAWTAWCAINLACFAGAMWILCRMLDGDWRTWLLVPLLTVISLPFIQAIGHGQNTCLSLLLLSATVALWRSDRAIAAGAMCGLLFYKPQLGAIVAAALVLSAGWRPLCGLALTGMTLLLTTLLTLPGTLFDFVNKLGPNVAHMQIERRYLWERHVTLKSFWRLLLQGYEIGEMTLPAQSLYLVTTAALAACLFAAILKLRKRPERRDHLIAMTIVTMPLLMPFYFDYDLLLLSAAAVLVARQHVRDEAKLTRPMLWMWIALYVWLMFNPFVAGRTHVNGTVVLLSGLAVMMIGRAMKREQVVGNQETPACEMMRQAA